MRDTMKQEFKSFVWGATVGVALAGIALLWSGWIVTGGQAREIATAQAHAAVAAALAPACVARFMEEPERRNLLTVLKGTVDYKRPALVREHGWAVLPGSVEVREGVAEQCAILLAKQSI